MKNEIRIAITDKQRTALISTLKMRFEKYSIRHKNIEWESLEIKLKAQPDKLNILFLMEDTGGEPDVVAYDKNTGQYTFFDCSEESPKGRRSLCYDQKALEARKEHKPQNSAQQMAAEIGIALLTEAQYRALQQLGQFDTKTSSWIATPENIRVLGGAIFADRRYGQVFIYHNGAESYYAARGFRGCLIV